MNDDDGGYANDKYKYKRDSFNYLKLLNMKIKQIYGTATNDMLVEMVWKK